MRHEHEHEGIVLGPYNPNAHSPADDVGQRVFMDADTTIKAVITGILFRRGSIHYELAWFANGVPQTAWIEDWRLTKAE